MWTACRGESPPPSLIVRTPPPRNGNYERSRLRRPKSGSCRASGGGLQGCPLSVRPRRPAGRLSCSNGSPVVVEGGCPSWRRTGPPPTCRVAGGGREPAAAAAPVRNARVRHPFGGELRRGPQGGGRAHGVQPGPAAQRYRATPAPPVPSERSPAQRRRPGRRPRHEEEPRDHGVELAALEGDLVGLDAAAAMPRAMAGGEDGGEVRRPERSRLPSAAAAGGTPVAGKNPGGAFPGRARLTGEAGPETRWSAPARRPTWASGSPGSAPASPSTSTRSRTRPSDGSLDRRAEAVQEPAADFENACHEGNYAAANMLAGAGRDVGRRPGRPLTTIHRRATRAAGRWWATKRRRPSVLPQQSQRHALAPQLPVDLAPVRQRPRRAARRRRRKQPTLQAGVVDRLWYGPTQPRHLGAAQVLAHRRRRRPQAAGDGSDAQRGGEVQPAAPLESCAWTTSCSPPFVPPAKARRFGPEYARNRSRAPWLVRRAAPRRPPPRRTAPRSVRAPRRPPRAGSPASRSWSRSAP